MLGAIAGDIVGSVYEFHNRRSTDFPLFRDDSFFTDDSVLTIALADAILGDADYAAKMREYYRRYPGAGYGAGLRMWAETPGAGPYHSYGNGAAMRISPVAWAWNTLDEVLEHALHYTALTHNHPEGIKGAQATAAAVFMGRMGRTKSDIRDFVTGAFGYDLSRTCGEIRPAYRFNETCQETVPQAIIAFLESDDFEQALRLAVSLGGDSDTLACITGAVAEAFYGGVPEPIARECLARLDGPLRTITVRFRGRYGLP